METRTQIRVESQKRPSSVAQIIFLEKVLPAPKSSLDTFAIRRITRIWLNTLKGVSLSRTFKKGTFSQFSLKQKIKTLVKDFAHVFRYIFELVKKKFSFENKKKSRTYQRSRAASHHGQLILRA